MKGIWVVPVLAGILILGSINPVYADVIRWDIFKEQNFDQTANNVQPTTPVESSLSALLATDNPTDFSSVEILGASPAALTQEGSDWFFFHGVFPPDDIDDDFPNQAYTFSASGNLGTFNENIDLFPERYPTQVPYLTGNSFDDLQGMDPTQDITITWNLPSSGGPQVTDVGLVIGEVSIAGFGTVFNSQFDVTTTSTVIPGNTLNPDESYFLSLFFETRLSDPADSLTSGIGETSFGFITNVLFDTSSAEPDFDGLVDAVEALNLHHGIENALTKKVQNAEADFNTGDTDDAVNKLNAFINQVNAQSGKKIDVADADALIAQAQALIDDILE